MGDYPIDHRTENIHLAIDMHLLVFACMWLIKKWMHILHTPRVPWGELNRVPQALSINLSLVSTHELIRLLHQKKIPDAGQCTVIFDDGPVLGFLAMPLLIFLFLLFNIAQADGQSKETDIQVSKRHLSSDAWPDPNQVKHHKNFIFSLAHHIPSSTVYCRCFWTHVFVYDYIMFNFQKNQDKDAVWTKTISSVSLQFTKSKIQQKPHHQSLHWENHLIWGIPYRLINTWCALFIEPNLNILIHFRFLWKFHVCFECLEVFSFSRFSLCTEDSGLRRLGLHVVGTADHIHHSDLSGSAIRAARRSLRFVS